MLTLDDGTQIQGGSTGGTSAGTLTIESTAELLVTSGSTSLGAGLDGMFVTDTNASKGIDVSGAALTLSDGTVISGGTMTVESTGGSTMVVTAGAGADAATARGATLTGVTVTDSSTGISGSGGIEVSGGVLTLNGGTDIVSTVSGSLVIRRRQSAFGHRSGHARCADRRRRHHQRRQQGHRCLWRHRGADARRRHPDPGRQHRRHRRPAR